MKHRIRSPNETQSESILFHGDVALIVIRAGLNDNGAPRHDVGGDASGDPSIRRLTRTGCFTIEVSTNQDPAHCYDNGHYFDDLFEANIEAISFQDR